MANPLPEEEKLYEQIKNERITVTTEIWDLIYNRLGDDISSINLLCQYYLDAGQDIPALEARKILQYTRHIKGIMNQVTCVSREQKGFYFPEIAEGLPLHPVIREMLTHYIGNDVYAINLMVGESEDRIDPQPVSIPVIQRVLDRTHSIKVFIGKLLKATSSALKEVNKTPDAEEKPKSPSTRKEVFLKIRSLLAKEFKFPNPDRIRPESRFDKDLHLDSVDAIRAAVVLEESFDLEIPDKDLDEIVTVGQAADYIYSRLNKERS
ncbi:MAG: phosphopantetheine-binding protein [Candidatus Omnitrophota bacterium]